MEETTFGPLDLHLFREGTHQRLWEKLGARLVRTGGEGPGDAPAAETGARFAVWAPGTEAVSVTGDFNGWKPGASPLRPVEDTGLWEGFVPGAARGARYRYHLRAPGGRTVERADPFGFLHDAARAASVVFDLDHAWEDGEWMALREGKVRPGAPIPIYQVHLGSWRRVPEEGDRPLTYREAAPYLADHLERTGFTHVELILFDRFAGDGGIDDWGPFAPPSRHGEPRDLLDLIDFLHRLGRGVILEWSPAAFRQGRAASDLALDAARGELRSFLLSSAIFWLDVYHVDGLRVDGVSDLVSGAAGSAGAGLLRLLNREAGGGRPDVLTIAADAPESPPATRPLSEEGLGFELAWDRRWAAETLEVLSLDPLRRKERHAALVSRPQRAARESLVLPLSYLQAAVPHGSLLQRMAGDEWQRFAHLRLLLGDLYAQPGKKLLFMGGELAQWNAWDPGRSLDWHLLSQTAHAGVLQWLGELNRIYYHEPALHELDAEAEGLEWIDATDAERSVLSFLRRGRSTDDLFLVVENFTPVARQNFRVGVPRGGLWREMLNGDGREYGGSGWGNLGGREAAPIPFHGRPQSINIVLPPLAVVFFKNATGDSRAGEAGRST